MPCKMVGRGEESDRIWSPFIIYDWNSCIGVKAGRDLTESYRYLGLCIWAEWKVGSVRVKGCHIARK